MGALLNQIAVDRGSYELRSFSNPCCLGTLLAEADDRQHGHQLPAQRASASSGSRSDQEGQATPSFNAER